MDSELRQASISNNSGWLGKQEVCGCSRKVAHSFRLRKKKSTWYLENPTRKMPALVLLWANFIYFFCTPVMSHIFYDKPVCENKFQEQLRPTLWQKASGPPQLAQRYLSSTRYLLTFHPPPHHHPHPIVGNEHLRNRRPPLSWTLRVHLAVNGKYSHVTPSDW